MIDGPDGWKLAPEGAAVHPAEKTAVIADVHLGYEWARASGGDCLPRTRWPRRWPSCSSLLGRAPIGRLVVAGDLVESPGPCRRTASDVRSLFEWLDERGVELVPVLGNHDPQTGPAPPSTLEVAGWTIGHGHRPIRARRTISGHHHPVLRAGGSDGPLLPGRPELDRPARLHPQRRRPARRARPGRPPRWLRDDIRCVAGLGGELLDFGPLPGLVATLRGG